jgi:probable F420-dependent oxidoreductase
MTTNTKFGITFGMHPDYPTPPEEMFSIAERLEKLEFDSLWIGDHIAFHGGYFSESLTTLAAFAARTSRLMIGSAVYLLPLRNPGVAAKCAATVDYLSGGGRFVFGIGVGGEGKEEFELCGIPVKERGARTDEALEIIRKLWTGEKASHQGRFWKFEDACQRPKPLTPGGPPIWIGGRSDAARKRSALVGDGYVSYLYTAKRFAQGMDQIHEWAENAGRRLEIEEGRWTPAHHAFMYIDEDADRALRIGTEYLSKRYNMDFRGIADKYLIHGPPDSVIEQIEGFKKAGARHFILRPTAAGQEDIEQLTCLAEEIIPKVRN